MIFLKMCFAQIEEEMSLWQETPVRFSRFNNTSSRCTKSAGKTTKPGIGHGSIDQATRIHLTGQFPENQKQSHNQGSNTGECNGLADSRHTCV